MTTLSRKLWKTSMFRRLLRDTRGGAVLYTAILLPALSGFVGLGVDVALWHVTKRQTQAMADAAAIGAALERLRVPDSVNLEAAATVDAQANGFQPSSDNTITVNSPPVSGPYQSVSGAVEVVIRVKAPQLLSSLIDKERRFVSSRAVGMSDLNGTCLWSLNPVDQAVIKVAGGSQVEFTCGVFANSSDPEAIDMSGAGSCLTGTEVEVVGGATTGCINPGVVSGAQPRSDPLETLEPPTSTGCTYSSNITLAGHGDATLSPGTYCGNINILTTGTVTLEPGIYIMDSSGINIGAQANVVGEGVTIYMMPGGQVSDNISISSGAVVELSAPETGTYAGIVIYQDRDSDPSITHQLTGGAFMDLAGIVYAPNQSINFSGGSSADSSNSTIISDSVNFTGNAWLAEFSPSQRLLNPLLVEARLVE